MNFSLTISGIATMVVTQIIGDAAPESDIVAFVNVAGLLIGAAMAWYGRIRKGDLTIYGTRK